MYKLICLFIVCVSSLGWADPTAPTNDDLKAMVKVFYETSEVYEEYYDLGKVVDVIVGVRFNYGTYPLEDTTITGIPIGTFIVYKKKDATAWHNRYYKHDNFFIAYFKDDMWRIIQGDLELYRALLDIEPIEV